MWTSIKLTDDNIDGTTVGASAVRSVSSSSFAYVLNLLNLLTFSHSLLLLLFFVVVVVVVCLFVPCGPARRYLTRDQSDMSHRLSLSLSLSLVAQLFV